MLDLKHGIMLMEVDEIAKANFSVKRLETMTVLIGGYRFYFYDSHEDANHDFEIIQRYVRHQNF